MLPFREEEHEKRSTEARTRGLRADGSPDNGTEITMIKLFCFNLNFVVFVRRRQP
jgi:hypothetical protein